MLRGIVPQKQFVVVVSIRRPGLERAVHRLPKVAKGFRLLATIRLHLLQKWERQGGQ